MKICRFIHPETQTPRYGMIEGEGVYPLRGDLAAGDLALEAAEAAFSLERARLLPPVTPSKIVCVGRNYREHAKELGNEVPREPLLFLKPPTAVIAAGERIRLPAVSSQVEFEGEIGVVVGRRLAGAGESEARDAVRGIVAANDVTARDLQRTDGQWTRAKGFDSFCPLGAESPPAAPLDSLELVTRVNGVERQRARASEMVFPIPALLAYISRVMTLEPDDLVLTGTPAGVGPLAPGDEVEVEVVGHSRVANSVVAAGDR
jgi:2-keto-4-pentenoate hydratase/2-oxohepta-3-ene-1,7-dioic acid hydratase in catechol pathway